MNAYKRIVAIATIVVFGFSYVAESVPLIHSGGVEEAESVLNNPSNNVVARIGFRAGGHSGLNSHELFGDNDDDEFIADLPNWWTLNASCDINVTYDDSGNLTLSITPPEGDSTDLMVTPSGEFNTILVVLNQNDGMPAMDRLEMSDNTVDGIPFDSLETDAYGEVESVEINFPDRNESNQPSVVVSSTFTPSGIITGSDGFNCTVYLVNKAGVSIPLEPEPEPLVGVIRHMNEGLVGISWPAADTNISYVVQKCYNLANPSWMYAGQHQLTTGGLEFSFSPSADAEYFRLVKE